MKDTNWIDSATACNDAIAALLDILMPISISIDVKSITGTPPYKENSISDYCEGRDAVTILVWYMYTEDTGRYYRVKLYEEDNKKKLIADKITIRDWHLVHYLQKAKKVSLG